LTRVVERQPGFNPASLHLAAAYVAANRPDEAKAIIDNVLTQVPTYTMADAERIYPYVKVDDRVRFLNGLRTAGIPEA
jgi:Tfp pilus assembly protein PilF